MLYWSAIFLIVSVVSSLFGFTGIATDSVGVAKFLFYLFVLLFVLSVTALLL